MTPRARDVLAGLVVAACIGGVAVGMMHLATEPLPPCSDPAATTCAGDPDGHSPNGDGKDTGPIRAVLPSDGPIHPGESTLPECVTEDSEDCVWDAAKHGNGEGRSFVRLDGVTYYAEVEVTP